MYNWTTLNTRVLKKLGFTLPKEAIEGAVFAQAGGIEPILKLLRTKLAQYQAKNGQERAANIPLLAIESPDGNVNGIFSRGAAGQGLFRNCPRSQAGATAGLNEVVDYKQNENDAGNYNEGTHGGYIQSFYGDAAAAAAERKKKGAEATPGLAAEVEDLKSLNQVLEIKATKLEQLLRLKDAKIAALSARLQGAGLISPARPSAPLHHDGAADADV
jgi:hypothetical protein